MLAKEDEAQRNASVNAVEMETNASGSLLWRLTKGVEPCAVKAARTVLNGGDEETYRKATRLVPTQLGHWRRLKPSVIATRGREFYCETQTKEDVISPGVMPPVPEPRVRRWQRRGIKHTVNR